MTLVATMAMVESALQAATRLETEGIDVEVIDPRTLRPLDEDTILKSVKKTSRLVIAHEGWKRWGFGAEVAAMVAEKAIDWLDAPILRVGARDSPMPYNDKLERLVIPSDGGYRRGNQGGRAAGPGRRRGITRSKDHRLDLPGRSGGSIGRRRRTSRYRAGQESWL